MTTSSTKPVLALAMGDPCGISPELTAKLLVDPEVLAAAHFVVVGDRRVLADGEAVAKVAVDVMPWTPGTPLATGDTPAFVDLGHLDPGRVQRGVASGTGGLFAITNFRTALRASAAGATDATTFTPFNKAAMKMATGDYEDEIAVITEETGAASNGREFNILGDLWNARVTSHIPLKDVSKHLTIDTIANALVLTDRSLREAGFANPRIAVAALNPHAGEGGNFGREEIDVIEPAVKAAQARGVVCEGPFPSDTVFVRARRGDYDAVQTMFHDQGQIAMKLMGFEAGVTLIGGYAFPICTPAHGTAYDIAGKGIANLGAARNAMLIAARMAKPRGMAAGERGRLMTAIVARVVPKAA